MRFEGGQFYHIYNRSFNRLPVFIEERNFNFFLQKVKTLNEYCELLAYCLMPDHFHLLIFIPEGSSGLTRQTAWSGQTGVQPLSRKLGTILSSYTQALNKQEKRTGSLFQPKTKAKLLDGNHPFICFHYIHQNPLKAALTTRLEEWLYSSFHEYFYNENGICTKQLAYDLLDIPQEKEDFMKQSYSVINYKFHEDYE